MQCIHLLPVLAAACTLILIQSSTAEVPRTMNYQGRLTDLGGDPIVGHRNMVFTLYDDSTGGTSLWLDTLLDVHLDSNGLFSAVLGDQSAIPAEIFNSPDVWLGIKLTVEPDEISPRTKLTSVAYSFQALKADSSVFALSVADNAITSSKIQDGSILLSDIGQNGADTGQVMKWDGNSWVVQDDSVGSGSDNDWSLIGAVLYTGGEYGIARAGNILNGLADSTHVNLGVNSVTGYAGQDFKYATVSGGVSNTAGSWGSTVGGGRYNTANGGYASVGGGHFDTASGYYATVGGGYNNVADGDYSAILGGYENSIKTAADYSYLFGISSELTEDSTFMVDMPHIRFGNEVTGYEVPSEDGTAGQVLSTDGSGQVSWNDVSPPQGFFPSSAWQSPWFLYPGGLGVLTHGLARNPEDLFVEIQQKSATHGLNSLFLGGEQWSGVSCGIFYQLLDSNSITISTLGSVCDQVDSSRVRIWIVGE